MHYSYLLLALSIPLHEHFAQDTSAAAETVIYPTRADTFLELKNHTRPKKSNENDERMFPTPSEKDTQEISELVAGKAQQIVGTEIFLPPAPQKSLEVIFEEIRAGAVKPTQIENVNHVLETMATEKIELAIEAFKMQNKFLADLFIDEWGIEAVTTTLVKAKHSDNEKIRANGKILLGDLLRSLDGTMHSDYPNIFIRLELDADAVERVGFADARVELMYDLIKYSMDRNANDYKVFVPLNRGFEDPANIALIIGLAKAEGKSAEALETRFVRYFVKSKVGLPTFLNLIILPEDGYGRFKLHQIEMMEKFLVLKGVRWKIPQKVLRLLIKKTANEGSLAIELSKAVMHFKNEEVAQKYEKLYFQYLKSKRHIGPDEIKNIFIEEVLASEPATLFIGRYRQWYDKRETSIWDFLDQFGKSS